MNNFTNKGINICLISLFFGKRPPWFPYFIKSCKANSEIDFFIFSDDIISDCREGNVKLKSFSLKDFNVLASTKLGFEIKVNMPYKLCDFRPAFGKIFEDYIQDYDFWGYCDNDLIFGDIKFFITQEIMEKYDIISVYKGFVSGPFCIFRNTGLIKELYKDVHDYKRILLSKKNYTVDENLKQASSRELNLMKIFCRLLYIIRIIAHGKFSFRRMKELRYQFQWYYKRKMFKDSKPIDFTEVIWRAEKLGQARALFKEILFSDLYYQRIGYFNWEFIWEKGKLIDNRTNKELFGFHFIESKKRQDFIINHYKEKPSFHINKNIIS